MKSEDAIARYVALFGIAFAALLPAVSHSQAPADSWQWRASIYGWFPTIEAQTRFPSSGSGSSIDVDADDILDALEFTFMGTLEARKGRWGVFTDAAYVNLSKSKSGSRDFTVGRMGLPADVSANLDYDFRALAWTVAGLYGLANTKENTTDLLFGARMISVKQTLDYAFSGNLGSLGLHGATGSTEVDETKWDAVVGVKGAVKLGGDGRWVLPYYLDLGTGESDFTLQALAGVGYSFGWGTVTAAWRYLDYDFKSGTRIEDLTMNGPLLGVTFRW